MPADSTLPMITRSTSSGFAPARLIASRTATAPRSEAESALNAPWNDPIGVRAALQMTTSFWLMDLLRPRGDELAFRGEFRGAKAPEM